MKLLENTSYRGRKVSVSLDQKAGTVMTAGGEGCSELRW